ncbi:hypothetical protein [Pararhodobacter aggregans]|uniref:hypothetical protein n=1 Tax=Pararhodobacter aggregans TaxID=404875 RepID=UPI000D4A1811|nr:hypothetical protein [Pararhodobacter aggregans]PTX01505.1 hypothetical protein C8N33_10770 [Pararhodobacter aggregans]
MTHERMIRDLEVLRLYARENGLPALAEHLDQAVLLAMTEIANRREEAGAQGPRH